jgi:hypothetical protein
MAEFYKIFKKELISILLKLFQKLEGENTFKLFKIKPALPGTKFRQGHYKKRKLYISILVGHRYKTPQQNSSK